MSYIGLNVSNSSSSSSNSSLSNMPSIDLLLAMLGFSEWQFFSTTYVLSLVSLLGIVLCSVSFWIFSNKKFKDPVFFYYRLLCLVYVIHLANTFSCCILFTPQNFPHLNTYLTAHFQIYYSFASMFLFHYEETLQIGILLMRMKTFSTFVKKHFSASPKIVSLAFLLTCLCIDAPIFTLLKVESFGTYYYVDSKSNGSLVNAKFYYYSPSDFSQTFFGKILTGLTSIFLNLILSVIVGVTLNIVSLVKYKSYVRDRRERQAVYINRNQNIQETEIAVEGRRKSRRELTQKEMNENRAEKNMFYMALSLCSIAIVSRVLIIFCGVYFLFFTSFATNILIQIINISIHTFVPALAIFVFYFFNKIFRQVFNEKFFGKQNVPASQ
jgi:hypothetical protein